MVGQRRDTFSTNSYSILPTLSKIGAIDSESAALFNAYPPQLPIFAFGPDGSGQSSLAMALSMLGYRCCSDLVGLPIQELKRLREGSVDRVFGAYVNVGCLEAMIEDLRRNYPLAKFIITRSPTDFSGRAIEGILARLNGADLIEFDPGAADAWRTLCEHLRCAPPLCPFPRMADLGQRHIVEACEQPALARGRATPKQDRSPWVVERGRGAWSGIRVAPGPAAGEENLVRVEGDAVRLNPADWSLRTDTFPGNLALFRPSNVECNDVEGVKIYVRQESLGARQFSAGALTSRAEYCFGRFEAKFKASNAPGVVTGFFLHRNLPHQEIDIEIAGNMPTRLLINVFYNPGGPGAKFDYGYRGSPSYIELGFDASKGLHSYAIEWAPGEIRWFVDDLLVHRRVLWDPTPIPHLPMKLHFNAWPSRASQLAGRLNSRRLPAMSQVQSIRVYAHGPQVFKRGAEGVQVSGEAVIDGAVI